MEFIDQILLGDCIEVLEKLPEKSVDLCFFSPPYWGLRQYVAKGESREIGKEATWHDFVHNMVIVCRAIWRVLKDEGSMFIVIGDTFIGGNQTRGKPLWWKDLHSAKHEAYNDQAPTASSVGHCVVCKRKQKLGLPWRVRLALNDDGWLSRNDIPWLKTNPNPTSHKDKWKNAHEYIFHLTKEPIYYFNQRAILRPAKLSSIKRVSQKNLNNQFLDAPKSGDYPKGDRHSSGDVLKRYGGKYTAMNPERFNSLRARTARDDYDQRQFYTRIVPEENRGSELGHKAVAPDPLDPQAMYHEGEQLMAVPPDFILEDEEFHLLTSVASFKKGLCRECGILYEAKSCPKHTFWSLENPDVLQPVTLMHHYAVYPETIVEQFVMAACPPGGIVLDPFVGTGTTMVVAKKLGRHYVGIDINPDSVETAKLMLRELL